MRKSPGLVVTGMMLVLAFPAAAKDRKMEGGENRIAARILPGHTVSGPRQTVNLDSRGLLPAVDPSAPRLFTSFPMGDNVALGVGLFSVLGNTEKEQVRRRLDPSRAMLGSSETRVAAVGMSLRF
jgi:hypothetical protein